MVKSWFFTLFIISALLSFSMSQERGRITTSDIERSPSEPEEELWAERNMVEMTMDYKEPGANTNPRSGLNPPPSTPRP